MANDGYHDSVSERQRRLLSLVVEHYIACAEAVGSRTLMEIMEGAVSSATIRNELSELDKMGYLEQPHTSAGRVPTVSGYRFYIDNLMHSRTLTPVERALVDRCLSEIKAGSLEEYVRKACDTLSSLTGCTAVASAPEIGAAVRRVEYFPMTPGSGIAAVLLSSGLIKSRIAVTEEPVSSAMLYRFLQIVNAQLAGKLPSEIGAWDYSIIAQATGGYARLFTPVLEAVNELLLETKQNDVFLTGQQALVESVGAVCAGDVLRELADKEILGALLNEATDETKVVMGVETGRGKLKDISVILSPYTYRGERAGSVGIVLGCRADYSRLLPLTDYFARRLGAILDFYKER